MTKRIAISVLLTVWTIIIVAGVTAYWMTRAILIANLDASMVARAAPISEGDRYVVKDRVGNTLSSSTTTRPAENHAPEPLSAAFGQIAGQRVRIVTVRT